MNVFLGKLAHAKLAYTTPVNEKNDILRECIYKKYFDYDVLLSRAVGVEVSNLRGQPSDGRVVHHVAGVREALGHVQVPRRVQWGHRATLHTQGKRAGKEA